MLLGLRQWALGLRGLAVGKAALVNRRRQSAVGLALSDSVGRLQAPGRNGALLRPTLSPLPEIAP